MGHPSLPQSHYMYRRRRLSNLPRIASHNKTSCPTTRDQSCPNPDQFGERTITRFLCDSNSVAPLSLTLKRKKANKHSFTNFFKVNHSPNHLKRHVPTAPPLGAGLHAAVLHHQVTFRLTVATSKSLSSRSPHPVTHRKRGKTWQRS